MNNVRMLNRLRWLINRLRMMNILMVNRLRMNGMKAIIMKRDWELAGLKFGPQIRWHMLEWVG